MKSAIFSLVAMLFLASCVTPTKPDRVTSRFDGKWEGVRILEQAGVICRETTITMDVQDGLAKMRLAYNGARMEGWIEENGQVIFHTTVASWNYKFKGKATEERIQGTWSVIGANCAGTWYVEPK